MVKISVMNSIKIVFSVKTVVMNELYRDSSGCSGQENTGI